MRAAIALLALGVATACSGGATGVTTIASTGAPTTTAPEATAASTTAPPAERPTRGVALSPRSYDTPEDMSEFLVLVPEAGDLLMHNGQWADALDPEGPYAVTAALAASAGVEPLFNLSVGSNQGLLGPLDDPQALIDAAVGLALDHDLSWIGLGNEVNDFATADPEGFEAYVALFDDAAAAIHEASPDTQVFVVFQYELLIGRHDGVFGGEITDPAWELLERFPRADAVALTTYPYLIVDDPADVPDDWYAPIDEHTSLPVLFTEVGWPAGDVIPGHHGSEEEQAEWVERFFELTAASDPEIVIWPFVFDTLIDLVAFDSIGLVRDDGSKRPAWDAWVGRNR